MNRIRVGIALALAETDWLTTNAIAEAIRASKLTVGEHLRQMEVEGYVTASLPAGPARRRATITWSLNTDRITSELDELRRRLN